MNDVQSLQLLQRCEAGEIDAIEELVDTYQTTVYRLALSILDDPSEADEVAQDTLLNALDHLASFRGEAVFTTWLYAITLNLCRGRLRKRRSHERLTSLVREVFRYRAELGTPGAGAFSAPISKILTPDRVRPARVGVLRTLHTNRRTTDRKSHRRCRGCHAKRSGRTAGSICHRRLCLYRLVVRCILP